MRLGSVVFPVVALFFLSEAVLSLTKRARFAARGRSVDRGTRALLVIVITAAIMAAVMLSGLPAGRIPWGTPGVPLAALGLLIAGFALRIWAVVTLGRFFTVDVAVHDDHVLVASGPYRVMRHPSYTGLLLEFAGLGVALGSFASVIVLVIPIGAALLHRIRVEEAALCSALGATYAAYAAKTKRLVPGVY